MTHLIISPLIIQNKGDADFDLPVKRGITIKEFLKKVEAHYKSRISKLMSEDGIIRDFIVVFVNGTDINSLQKDKTLVKDSDTVTILSIVSGG